MVYKPSYNLGTVLHHKNDNTQIWANYNDLTTTELNPGIMVRLRGIIGRKLQVSELV